MPTVLRIEGYRFFFYSNENNEPCHIHVQRERMPAKFSLQPTMLASSSGFTAHELRRLIDVVEAPQHTFLEAWNEFFGT